MIPYSQSEIAKLTKADADKIFYVVNDFVTKLRALEKGLNALSKVMIKICEEMPIEKKLVLLARINKN